MTHKTLARCLLIGLALLGTGACSEHDDLVTPDQSIQAAIDRIPAGATTWRIEVKPGIYREKVSVDRSGVTLRGSVTGAGPEDRPVLDGTLDGGRLHKDAVIVSGSQFTIEGFTVRNYSGNGVTTTKARDIVMRDLITDNTGLYGVYPVESENILVERCTATRIRDAGIYVGQSKNAIVRDNHVYGNVAGIEIENTVTALVENNDVHDNTVGLLVFVLPNNPSKVGADCTLRNNKTYKNNTPNFGDPTATVSKLPYGIGVFVMGADNTLVENNEIRGNDSVGAAIVGVEGLVGGPGMLDIEPNSDGTVFRNNSFADNGKKPDKRYLDFQMGLMGGDFVWDGTGKGNCISEPQDNELRKEALAAALPRCK
jgi:cytochrome c peroxidase